MFSVCRDRMHLREPRYLFGLDEAENLIHVKDASAGKLYSCPGCSSRLIPHKNGHRQQHFKHFHADACNGETYLHALSKWTFLNWYRKRVSEKNPVLLELPRTIQCTRYSNVFKMVCATTEVAQFNLVQYFDEAILEHGHDRFRPDILLRNSSSKEVLFVEIAVTHPCEQDKIDSGIRIIEFHIQSEEDLETLISSPFLINQSNIRRYNFSARPLKTTNCRDECLSDVEVLTVDDKGVVRNPKGKCRQVGADIDRLNPVEVERVDRVSRKRQKLRDMLIRARTRGVSRLNCYLCAESRDADSLAKVLCVKKSKVFSYTEAERCGFFKATKE